MFILLLVLSISFTSCSFIKPKLTETQLSADNIKDYFNINGYSDGYNESHNRDFLGFDNYTCSCNMNISVDKMYDFEIKEPIKLKFEVNSSWDSISGAETEDYIKYVYITIPTSGSINKTYSCSTKTYFTMADRMPVPYLKEATGTIYVAE